jgi:hypothetical protein
MISQLNISKILIGKHKSPNRLADKGSIRISGEIRKNRIIIS